MKNREFFNDNYINISKSLVPGYVYIGPQYDFWLNKKDDIYDRLEQSIQEIQIIKEEQLPKKEWSDFLMECPKCGEKMIEQPTTLECDWEGFTVQFHGVLGYQCLTCDYKEVDNTDLAKIERLMFKGENV